MKLKLTIKRPPARGEKKGTREVVSLDQACCVIGRTEADVVIGDSRCSAQHALLFESFGGKLRIRDLDSTNGTHVNGEIVKEIDLKVSDEILIGKTTIVIADFTSSTFSKLTLESPDTVRPHAYRDAMPRHEQKRRTPLPPPDDIVFSRNGNFSDIVKGSIPAEEKSVDENPPETSPVDQLAPETASHVVDYIDEKGSQSRASVSQILNLRRLVDEDE